MVSISFWYPVLPLVYPLSFILLPFSESLQGLPDYTPARARSKWT